MRPLLIFASAAISFNFVALAENPYSSLKEGDARFLDFHFHSGGSLPELRIRYRTLGELRKDSAGRSTNAVLILHGTGGSGGNFLSRDYFHGELFGPGQPLDVSKYFIIFPDNIGHGHSSKPSDALRAKFPRYGYLDMVASQKRVLEETLGVNHLRLILGTSMGCMHAWIWGTTYPEYADALMPLACLPHPITGRNLLWRLQMMDLIRSDPGYHGGDYAGTLPAMKAVADISYLMSQNPQQLQKHGSTREKAIELFEAQQKAISLATDPNDFLYQMDSSFDYDPLSQLERITAKVLAINFADDPINPPDLEILQREIRRVKRGSALVMPATPDTFGHGNHSRPALWKHHLVELLH